MITLQVRGGLTNVFNAVERWHLTQDLIAMARCPKQPFVTKVILHDRAMEQVQKWFTASKVWPWSRQPRAGAITHLYHQPD